MSVPIPPATVSVPSDSVFAVDDLPDIPLAQGSHSPGAFWRMPGYHPKQFNVGVAIVLLVLLAIMFLSRRGRS